MSTSMPFIGSRAAFYSRKSRTSESITPTLAASGDDACQTIRASGMSAPRAVGGLVEQKPSKALSNRDRGTY
jgi:hypothetical protein